MPSSLRRALAVALISMLMPGVAFAQNKCAGEKLKATALKVTCKIALEAKQAAVGGTIDPIKYAKCESKFASTFEKREAKGGCKTTGDSASVEAKVDALVADLDSDLAVGALPNKCQGAKLKAAAKRTQCKLNLESKQAAKGGAIDPDKVLACEATFASTFAKSESKGPCNATNDAAAIGAKVDAFVSDADFALNCIALTCLDTFSCGSMPDGCGGTLQCSCRCKCDCSNFTSINYQCSATCQSDCGSDCFGDCLGNGAASGSGFCIADSCSF